MLRGRTADRDQRLGQALIAQRGVPVRQQLAHSRSVLGDEGHDRRKVDHVQFRNLAPGPSRSQAPPCPATIPLPRAPALPTVTAWDSPSPIAASTRHSSGACWQSSASPSMPPLVSRGLLPGLPPSDCAASRPSTPSWTTIPSPAFPGTWSPPTVPKRPRGRLRDPRGPATAVARDPRGPADARTRRIVVD